MEAGPYRRLTAFFVVALALSLSVALLAAFLLRNVIVSKDLVIFGHAQDVLLAEDLSDEFARKVAADRAYLLSADRSHLVEMVRHRSRALTDLTALRERAEGQTLALVNEAARAELAHHEALERILAVRAHRPSEAVDLWERELLPLFREAEARIAELVRHERERLEAARQASTAAATQAAKLLAALLGMAGTGGVAAVVLFARTSRRIARTEADLERRLRMQDSLTEFARQALATNNREALYREAMTLVQQNLGTSHVGLLELHDDGAALVPAAGIGWPEDAVARIRIPLEHDTLGTHVYRTRTPVVLADLRSDTRFKDSAFLREQGIVSGFGMPMLSHERMAGVLCAFTREPRDFREEDLGYPRAVGYILAAAVERSRGEERLRESEERFRLIVDSVQDYGIYMLDPEGRVIVWNSGCERLKGYAADEVLGRSFELFYTPEAVAEGRPAANLQTALETGRAVDQGWRVRKDGSRFWADVVITPMFEDDGRLRGYAKVCRDLTEQKEAQDEIQRLNAELERRLQSCVESFQNVIQELDSFAYTVAHDLRAPLRAMSGFSQALVEDYSGRTLDPAGQDYARRIREAANRLDGLIQDLLTFSRMSRHTVRLKEVDSNGVIDRVLQTLAPEIRERGARVEVDRPLPAVLGHETLLAQALTNLVANAVKFVAPDVPPRVRIFSESDDGRVRLLVEDNGIGIPPEHHGRLFRVFERLHKTEEYPGTGIGLAIVKRAAERQDGRVGFASQPGKGSRFWIELKAASSI